jgi:tRNA(Ile)-lysidine synthase
MNAQDFLIKLAAEARLEGKQPVIVAVSGGPDSLSLLHLLAQTEYALVVAHYDHGLRPDSQDDLRFVKQIARLMDLPFHGETGDVRTHADQQSLSIEAAARDLRYEFLFNLAADIDAQAVATGHTADDQVETLLINLLRGTGLTGLRGMPYRSLPNQWSESIPLLRPLISYTKQELLDYCDEVGLQPISDPSNSDLALTRNRIRHDLLPTLEQFSPGLSKRLLQSAELLSEDYKLVEALTSLAWEKSLNQAEPDYLSLDRQKFLNQPRALRRMLLRRAYQTLRPGDRNLDFAAVERLLQSLTTNTPGQQDWLSGLYFMLEDNSIWLADRQATLPVDGPQMQPGQNHSLTVPSHIELENGWSLKVEESNAVIPPNELSNIDPFHFWLEKEKMGSQLTIRTRKPADRFKPLGMQEGSMKLSDFMINEKIPQRARDAWPLLSLNQEICWVPGYRVAQAYRFQRSSHHAVHITLTKITGD